MYEITFLYSMACCGLLSILALRRPVYHFAQAYCPLALRPFYAIERAVSSYLVYPTVAHGGKSFDRWSRRDVLLLLAYIGATISCIVLPLSGINQIILRSGTLAVVNVIFCYAGPYLGFLADVLGLSLRSCRRLHGTVGTLAVGLAALHAAAGGAAKGRLDLHSPKDVFGLMVGRFPYILPISNKFNSPFYVCVRR